MALETLSKPRRTRRSTKSSTDPRASLVTLAFATRALKKITPSSQTLQKFLVSATLMHPEMYSNSRPVVADHENPAQSLLEANPFSPPATGSDSLSDDAEDEYDREKHPKCPSPTTLEGHTDSFDDGFDTMNHFRSTISSQRHLTFPQSSEAQLHPKSSLEMQHTRASLSQEIAKPKDYSMLVNDSTRAAIHTLLRRFPDKPMQIHGSQRIQRHDIAPMIELHMLACREDRFVQRIQSNQIAKAEIQSMRNMLGDRTTSALDNVLVARIEKSDSPADIIGWLCCSIVRNQPNKKSTVAQNGTRILDWNVATAVNLNKGYNTGAKTFLNGDPVSLRERNNMVEVVCRGVRWSQKAAFRNEDFIAITNLVVHPNYPAADHIRKQLVMDACDKAKKLGMPLYACVPEESFANLYEDHCGFTEIGDHICLSFEPEYRWKYLVHRPPPQVTEFMDLNKKDAKSKRFDFGWGALKGST